MTNSPSEIPSPTTPRMSSSPRKGSRSALSLDLSDLPPLIQPSPPSNTLLITNLNDPAIFHPASLESIRNLINEHAPIHTWAPLKSFRRIICSFWDVDSAVLIRQKIDGEVIMGDRVRVYFGAPTPLSNPNQHLQAPKLDKLFFISPPPSPPHGWEMRNEEPPNKEVHADDLASALAKLHAHQETNPMAAMVEDKGDISPLSATRRSRSSTIVYHPGDHGDSPDLPAIAVEDADSDEEDVISPMEGVEKTKIFHTSRPPVELME